MDTNTALEIILALTEGIDPETGEMLSSESCFNRPQVIRALFTARSSLEESVVKEKRRSDLPTNAGKPWQDEEEKRLVELFDSGQDIGQLARELGRTKGSITARLIRLGKIIEH